MKYMQELVVKKLGNYIYSSSAFQHSYSMDSWICAYLLIDILYSWNME